MSCKSLLLFADSSKEAEARGAIAASLAQQHGARLEIYAPVLQPSVDMYGDTIALPQMYAELLEDEREATGATTRVLAHVCAEAGVKPDFLTPECSRSDAARIFADLGQTASLLIVGQPHAEGRARHLQERVLECALFRSGRPVLVLPPWTKPRAVGKRILVGWKPTREASRAVHDALPLLQAADSVRLFTGSDESVGQREYAESLARLSSYLAAYGVPLPAADAGASMRDIGLTEEARLWGADLIVMGAYGHARLREIVFGGATRDALLNSHTPLLLSH